MEFNLIVGGEAGHGLHTTETVLTDLLFRLHYHFFSTRNYMSRIRGGHNFHMVRIADHPVHALSGLPWDMLIAIDEESAKRHRHRLRDKGIFIPGEKIREIETIAQESFGDRTAANAVIAGMILSVIGCSPEKMEAAGAENIVLGRLKKGFDIAAMWNMAGQCPIIAAGAKDRFRFDGNQALAFGAILGGCQFMAAYPMTPATSAMNYFSRAALLMPIHFEQAEDEIAAINMALGASYAGLRAMVATSGGGFALMQEAVSLAGMTETPIVIAEAQRPGPSTGLPTRTEQGDLNIVLYSGQGDFPRIVFAPGSIAETIDIAKKSFDLADRYQIPVFIMTDQYFADSIQTLEEDIPLNLQTREYRTYDDAYRRYALTPDGVSSLTYPGLGDALVKVDSDEHDEEGKITEDLDLRNRMVEKRLKKFDGLRKEAILPVFSGDRNAEAVIVCWGSNKLIVQEAVERLRGEGKNVGSLHFSQVYPLTEAMISGFDPAAKRFIILENNATGQFAGLLRRELGIPVRDCILKYDGECFTVQEVCDRVRKILEG